MKKIIRTAAAAAAFTVAGVGMAGVAVAQDTGYVPSVETKDISAHDPQVAAATVQAGALPYTGHNSTLPLAEAGVALVAGGGALLLVVKRRQASSNS